MEPVKAQYRRPIIRWLLACAGVVALMVLLGGYTRITGSGLSITQWKPIHGVIPPLSPQEWQEEFKAYKATPQFSQINSCMTMPDFKAIFWPEFLHRLLGRIAGMVFFLPFLWFAWRRAFTRQLGIRLALIFGLGGLQGLIGWYMVKSGLLMGPYVSHFRLALHLSMAFFLFALLLWTALDVAKGQISNGKYQKGKKIGIRLLTFVFCLLCLQIIYGAFMAGLHAGMVYNTFPDMNGQFVPDDMWALTPWWENPFSNIATVQFIHRWLAMVVAAGALFWWWRQRKHAMHGLQHAIAATVLLQVGLGILTLLYQVPLLPGLLHQLNALALFGLMVTALHKEKP